MYHTTFNSYYRRRQGMKFGITPNVHEFLKIVVGEFEKLDTRINELNR